MAEPSVPASAVGEESHDTSLEGRTELPLTLPSTEEVERTQAEPQAEPQVELTPVEPQVELAQVEPVAESEAPVEEAPGEAAPAGEAAPHEPLPLKPLHLEFEEFRLPSGYASEATTPVGTRPSLSPRRRGNRFRSLTPKGAEIASLRTPSQSSVGSLDDCDAILTPSQAAAKNLELRGFRFVLTSFLSGSALNLCNGKRKRKPVDRDSPAKTVDKTSSWKTPKRVPTQLELADQARAAKIEMLQRRLELLKERQAVISASQPQPSTSASLLLSSVQEEVKPPPAKKPKKPKPPPTAPTHANSSPNLSSTPSFSNAPLTPNDGKSSRSGRLVKAPKFLNSDDEAPAKLNEPLRRCRDLLTTLMQQKNAHFFNEPVDPEKFNIPDYFNVITHPMDLGTIKSNLTAGSYADLDAFASDVRLVWSNAILFNQPETIVHESAKEYEALFERKLAKLQKPPAPRPTPKRAATPASASHPKKTHAAGTGIETQLAAMQASLAKLESAVSGGSGKPLSGASTPKPPRVPKSLANVPLTNREKQILKTDIFKLPSNKLEPIIQMCSKNSGIETKNDDSVTIDIDKLDVPTGRELQKYVKKCLGQMNRKKPGKESAKTKASPNTHAPSPSAPLSSPKPSPQTEATGTATQKKHSDSDSESDTSSGSSDSESESDDEAKKSVATPSFGEPIPSGASAPADAFGAPALYSATPFMGQPVSSSPVDVSSNFDESKEIADAAAWSNLGEPLSTSSSSDVLWSSFKNKEQENRDKEQERKKMEAQMAVERVREADELRRKAEAEALRVAQAREQEALRRDQERDAQREAARLARQNTQTVDLSQQSMLMDLMDSFG